MAKVGGLSKLGPSNLYERPLACRCPRPMPEHDPEDGSVHCVKCGAPIQADEAAA